MPGLLSPPRPACAFAPLGNPDSAYVISQSGLSFTPWASYTSQVYSNYLDDDNAARRPSGGRAAGRRSTGHALGSTGMELLSDDEISTGLASLPGWTRDGSSITRTVTLADFRAAMLYVGAVAYLAEQANHHPDLLIQWNKVTLTLSTHSAGGLTGADFALAGKISALS